MRFLSTTVVAALGPLAYLPGVFAWGAAGHEIVATIAQMYLHPNVLPTLCGILDMPLDRCHLAPVSTWADQHRNQMRWSAPLHYVGALDDHPSQSCAFPGGRGWAGSAGVNVLDGIKNTTSLLEDWVNHDASDAVASEALKFLIHFVGDMHQPLHLTGRDRGGNSVKVVFGRRHTNLHSLWDTYLIAKAVRLVPRNYSRPLPYPTIEKALRGTIYDSYIRRILWEGALNPWANEMDTWLKCPVPLTASAEASGLLGMWQSAYSVTSKLVQFLTRDGVEINPDGAVVCPYFWAQPSHKLNCDIIWPKELDEPPFNIRFNSASDHEHHHHGHEEDDEMVVEGLPLLNLDTPEYAGVIEKELIIERLLTQGGIRLAGVLNYLFADDRLNSARGAFLQDFRA
ncbi:hypothetical protein GALMADRAFT_101616 [Galerina marginata CBS 339.88]|uniref:Phospholipase C/P1 nuclease n=1 Tax=Galerina marginata (strain CBS 339.88) TaxID=685588 RepID=A0A067SNL0_GALM3|nr:hypothetical protein GALMADRAFT_101616 [Galerina marginata CBS 339.88]